MREWALMIGLLALPAQGDSVDVAAGNVVLHAPGGKTRILTNSGHDREATLSPDGRWVAFVRETPASGDGAASTEIRVVPARGGPDRLLVASGHACGNNADLQVLATPQFLSDSVRIVFESAYVATSGSAHLTSLASGGCRYLAPANDVRVVRGGEYRDWLILNQHRYFLAGGSYDWYWLFNLEGQAAGPVGPDDDSVSRFLEEAGGGDGG